MNARRVLAFRIGSLVALLIAAPLVAPSFAASDVSQQRTVPAFQSVRLTGALAVRITAGASQTRVTVRGPADRVDRILTRVEGDTLVVEFKSGNNVFERTPQLTIALPVLRSLKNEGAGSIDMGGLNGNDVAIGNNGAASIVARGRVTKLAISLDGTGKIDTTALDARDVTVDNNGFGSIRVRASGTLTANVNGVGEIRYTGNPAHVNSQINGIGRISRL